LTHPLSLNLADARDAQRRGDVAAAEAIYRAMIAADGNHVLAINELAVLCSDGGRMRDAAVLLLRACELSDWRDAVIRRNLRAVVAQVASGGRSAFHLSERGQQYRSEHQSAPVATEAAPLVSVILVCESDAAEAIAALDSVSAQDYSRLEVILVGTVSGAAVLNAVAQSSRPLPIRRIESQGAEVSGAVNAGVAAARGEFVHLLFDRDRLHPARIGRMVREVAARGLDFGFGAVCFVDGRGEAIDRFASPFVFESACVQAAMDWHETRGFAFISDNPAITAGNLFVRRDFLQSLGGFANLNRQMQWDFVLRALFVSEPAYVPDATYLHRIDEVNLSPAELQARLSEAVPMLADFIEKAFSVVATNRWAPTYGNWGSVFVTRLLTSPVGELVTPVRMRMLVNEFASNGD
jgi:GT2 family glycosyltransferase